ncbi:hypothetical protein ACFXJJ_30605, partial [Streptomyces sp. NPDC059233]
PMESVEPNVRGEQPAPASRPGPVVSVADAAVRDRDRDRDRGREPVPPPAIGPTLLSTLATPLPPLHPSPPATTRPVSLLR